MLRIGLTDFHFGFGPDRVILASYLAIDYGDEMHVVMLIRLRGLTKHQMVAGLIVSVHVDNTVGATFDGSATTKGSEIGPSDVLTASRIQPLPSLGPDSARGYS